MLNYRGGLLLLLSFATLSAPAQQATGPVRISAGVSAGQLLTKVAPQYPSEARAQGVSGTVVMHAIVAIET